MKRSRPPVDRLVKRLKRSQIPSRIDIAFLHSSKELEDPVPPCYTKPDLVVTDRLHKNLVKFSAQKELAMLPILKDDATYWRRYNHCLKILLKGRRPIFLYANDKGVFYVPLTIARTRLDAEGQCQ